jgi:hypothetical protein
MSVTMACPHCGKPLEVFDWHCAACGTSPVGQAPIAPAPPQPSPEPMAAPATTKPCPTCGVANPVAYRFCGACSARFPS